ncbi:hypothetical protein SELMODRAFT_414363 [Selaginella moellendorffii]|uniref:IBH1-like N-terminal domain-containing protein n=1 Tax=Selaginella moellendorffii TaxID=88036 RepID=D8RSH9_SELML|nr:transcription factor IBH1-like 1 [Selaginella moellendorffii]EFJ25070.1 hypothetical protein SELMODRAFT_414363 [Selaginella moellendorffii]|eukprot:XP_002974115.1 transcription factor IBH1-like 1 [Selaginella moellendorffii]
MEEYYGRKYAGYLLPSLAAVMRSSSSLSVDERDQVIKLVADGSLAATARGTSCCWSGALARQVLGGDRRRVHRARRASGSSRVWSCVSKRRSRVCLRRSLRKSRRQSCEITEGRIEVLKDLIPGGRLVKSSAVLLQEAVDYMMFLEVQVGVLSSLAAGVIDL